MNSVILLGRLTHDPEQRQAQSGVEVSTFTLAVNRQFKNKNGDYEADFIRCVAFNRAAQLIGQYLRKGSQCAVEGRIQTRNYEKDGQRHYVTEVVVDRVQFIGGEQTEKQKPSTGDIYGTDGPFANDGETIDISDDDLPF